MRGAIITGLILSIAAWACTSAAAMIAGTSLALTVTVVAAIPILIAVAPVLLLRRGSAKTKIATGLSGIALVIFIVVFMGMTVAVWAYAPAAVAMLLAFVGGRNPEQPQS